MSPAELELWQERLTLMSNPAENLLSIDEEQDREGDWAESPYNGGNAAIGSRASAASSSGS